MLARSTPLTLWDRIGLLALLAGLLVLGVVTVQRMLLGVGDFNVYTSAAWAVRSGASVRDMMDIHGWHYTYPPTLAVLMTPLAEPPDGETGALVLPRAVSAALWYTLNLFCLIVAVHTLARALMPSLPAGSRPWWRLRILPALACAAAVGHTLTRGQVNLILLLLISGFLAATLRGRAWQAGIWLAGAICLKLIPAFLLLVPLWRRDVRCLAGCTAGLLVIGLFIPMLGLGVEGTINDYREFGQMVLGPGLGYKGDTRAEPELTNITTTFSQSPLRILHAWTHADRETRSVNIPVWIRRTHWLLGATLVMLVLLAGADLARPPAVRGIANPIPAPSTTNVRPALLISLLTINMLLLSPVCHTHYLCLAIPVFTAMLAWDWQRRDDDWMSWRLACLMGLFLLGTSIPYIPGLDRLKDVGLPGLVLLLVWLAGLKTLWDTRPSAACRQASGSNYPQRRSHASPSTSFSTSSET